MMDFPRVSQAEWRIVERRRARCLACSRSGRESRLVLQDPAAERRTRPRTGCGAELRTATPNKAMPIA